MNNDYLVERSNPEYNELPRSQFSEKRAGEVQKILEALYGLKNSNVFKKAVEKLLNPRLESLSKRLRQESDPVQLYRLQGMAGELERMINLEKLVEVNEKQLQNLKGQITQTHAEEEKRKN